MSIERPSLEKVRQYNKMMEGKKHTGDASSVTPHVLGIGAVAGIFTFLLHRSLNPQGLAARMQYEQSLSLINRRTRHILPWVFLVGSLYAWDVSQGVWDPIKKSA